MSSCTYLNRQEEYQKEGIQWTPIDYFNNKVVVDLIESKKPPGIMAVLDDTCFTMHAVSEGADETFVQKMTMNCSQNKHYQGMSRQFVIHHYAGSVTYDCEGFVDANKDTLFKDLIQLMQMSSKYVFIACNGSYQQVHLFWDCFLKKSTKVIRNDLQRCLLRLRISLKNLSKRLCAACLHMFDASSQMKQRNPRIGILKGTECSHSYGNANRVEHQVRYLNLKENIKVRRAGFCYRNLFEKFLKRYIISTIIKRLGTLFSPKKPFLDGMVRYMTASSISCDPLKWIQKNGSLEIQKFSSNLQNLFFFWKSSAIASITDMPKLFSAPIVGTKVENILWRCEKRLPISCTTKKSGNAFRCRENLWVTT